MRTIAAPALAGNEHTFGLGAAHGAQDGAAWTRSVEDVEVRGGAGRCEEQAKCDHQGGRVAGDHARAWGPTVCRCRGSPVRGGEAPLAAGGGRASHSGFSRRRAQRYPPQENCTRNILSINRLLIGMVLYCTLECLPTITKQLASTNEWPLHMLGVTANWSVPCRSRFVCRHYKYIILARTHFYKAFHNPEILGGVLRLSCISHLPPPQVRSKSPFKEGGTLQGRVFPILNMRTA